MATLLVVLPIAGTGGVRSLALYVPLVLWLAGMLWRGERPRSTSLDLPFLAFLAWGSLALVVAVDPPYSLHELYAKTGVSFLLFYLVVHEIRQEQVPCLLWVFAGGSLVMGIYGVGEAVRHWEELAPSGYRVRSLTSDYNFFSNYLAMAIPLLTALTFKAWGKGLQVVAATAVGISLLCLFLTFSRAAWLGVALATLALLAFAGKRFRAALLLVLLVLTLALGAAFLRHEIGIGEQSLTKVDTAAPRLAVWRMGVEEVLKHPLAGIGYGRESFLKAYPGNPITREERGIIHTHNTFLEMALQLGLPGLAIFIWLIGVVAFVFWEGMRRAEGKERLLLLGLLAMMLSYFTRNAFDHMHVGASAHLFWLLVGLGFVIRGSTQRGAFKG
ncbi:MAG: O-antigen ligase family protein [Nitrospirae bacterium]|nr:O-antigen ligase family protein [Nitrospirota bacterium]